MLALRRRLTASATIRERAEADAAAEAKSLKEAEAELAAALEAQSRLQGLARGVEETAHRRVAEVVSRCLQAVFPGEAPELAVRFERKRGRTEARFCYLVGGGNEVDPRTTSGGWNEVAALALRLVRLVLARPQPRKFLALDEPFLAVSAANRPRVAALLETLAVEMGVQFLIVTHDDAFRIGKEIRL